ncbi:MAG: SRPBCC family protein [Geodermatophilaceae bacterium]|nr:SRPBCC family protein [Geodermatophilaceae bacterium]MDQ3475385.1 SRPBCC family protein [Actinomycetota bacterium]
MQLEHSFTVPVPVDDAWKVLLDIEQIAPCMPGAVLDSVDGDDFTGRVKVKLGPISLTYKGKASFVTKDEATHTAVIDAAGKDQRGNGTAAATVTATLTSEGSSTRVDVLTDLNITGKPAQFGRGVMVDVGNKLIGQFATCVEGKLSGTQGSAEPDNSSAGAGVDRHSDAGSNDTPLGAAAVVAAGTAGGTGGTSGTGGTDNPVASTGGKHAKEPGPTPTASTGKASRPRAVPSREPEPIDLLEVAGGSVLTRMAVPAAGLGAAVLILLYIIRKIRS